MILLQGMPWLVDPGETSDSTRGKVSDNYADQEDDKETMTVKRWIHLRLSLIRP